MINILATVLLALVTLMAFVFVTLTVIAFVKGFIKGTSKKNMYLVRTIATVRKDNGGVMAYKTNYTSYVEANSLSEAVEQVSKYKRKSDDNKMPVFANDDKMFWDSTRLASQGEIEVGEPFIVVSEVV